MDKTIRPLAAFRACSRRSWPPSSHFNPRNRLTSLDTTRADTDLDGAFDADDFSTTTAHSLTIAEGSNRLLGFTQSLTNVRGTRTLSSASAQVAYTLDAAGNLTSDGLRSFNMDANGRLAQVRLGLGSEEAATTYLHNALGQRVFKSEPQATQYAPDEEELGSDFINWLKKNFGWLFAKAQANATLGQSFVYADAPLPEWALLGEYGNGGSKSAGRLEIVWLPTEDGGALPVGLYRNGRFYAVHPDHLGTPRLITDDGNKPVWQWPYSAFGANKPTGILKATPKAKQAFTNEPVLLKATNPAIGFNLRFPGQYFDEESNLNYNYFRNYMPSQGRYSQADPIGLDGGLNRFGYVGGDALGNADPKGLCPWCVAGLAGAASDILVQLAMNGFDPQCIDWIEVGVAAATSSAGIGLAQRFAKVSTAFGGVSRPTHRFMVEKGKIRVESHPISKGSPNWYSYPHWHLDAAGKPIAKMHLPVVEPLVSLAAVGHNMTKAECECKKK